MSNKPIWVALLKFLISAGPFPMTGSVSQKQVVPKQSS